jgi:hypothetical protein
MTADPTFAGSWRFVVNWRGGQGVRAAILAALVSRIRVL